MSAVFAFAFLLGFGSWFGLAALSLQDRRYGEFAVQAVVALLFGALCFGGIYQTLERARDSDSGPSGLRHEAAQGEAPQSGLSESEGIARTTSATNILGRW